MSDWKALADSAMANLGFNNKAVVYATIEAETNGRNVASSDLPNTSYGYGQATITYWKPQLMAAGKALGIAIPSDNKLVRALVLSNDKLSMYWSVEVIKTLWNANGGNWDSFTTHYVGSKIPAADRERRRKIYQKYIGGAVPKVPPTQAKTCPTCKRPM